MYVGLIANHIPTLVYMTGHRNSSQYFLKSSAKCYGIIIVVDAMCENYILCHIIYEFNYI